MEKIIFRKFLYDFISFFLTVSLSLSLIVWIIQSVNYLDFISQDGHGFKVYFAFIALNFPKIFSKIIIFSYFVSMFYIIQKYHSNNEILIFWTNGISKIKLINFIIKISIIFAVIQILIVNFIVPQSQSYSKDFIRSSNIDLFASLITEKKFIDTVKDFTIFVENIDTDGNMKNIYLKDSVNQLNTQIITAKSGKIIQNGQEKFLKLNYGQILDIENEKFSNTKVIKFNNTTFSLSNLKSKSTTFPKIQELNSQVLISCVNNFLFGEGEEYILPIYQCKRDTYMKGAKELFNRSIKQFYIIILGMISAMLIFLNDKNPNNFRFKVIIFMIGIVFAVLSEINAEFLNYSIINNLLNVLLPSMIFIFGYFFIINFSKHNI